MTKKQFAGSVLTIVFVCTLLGLFNLKVECSPLKDEVKKELTYWANKIFDCGEKRYKTLTLRLGKHRGDYLIYEIDKRKVKGKIPVLRWE